MNDYKLICEYLEGGMRYIDRSDAYRFIGIYKELLGEYEVHTMRPMWVGLKVTSKCNCNCIHCWVEKKQYTPTFEKIVLALDKLKELEIMHITISGGEPFLRHDIFSILQEVKKHRFHLEIFTNASLLNESKISKLAQIIDSRDVVQVSFDASNEEIFNLQRIGGDFFTLMKNIQLLVDYGIMVRLNFTATHNNQYDISKAFFEALKLGAATFSLSHVFDINKGESLYDKVDKDLFLKEINNCLAISQKSRMEFRPFIPIEYYSSRAKKLMRPNKRLKQHYPILDWFIHSDGSIYPDVTLEYPEFCLGNIYIDSVKEIRSNIKKKESKLFYRDLSNTKCEYCDQYYLCQGGERGRAYRDNDKLDSPDSRCHAFEE
ncbi:radical SAM protein [Roseburia hominis]